MQPASSIIEEVFARYSAGSASGYDAAWLDGVPAAFHALLGEDDVLLRSLPILTASALRSGALATGALVRYAGLVQDQFDPEFYTAVAEVRDARGAGAPRTSLRPLAFTDFAPAPAPGVIVELRNDIMERRHV